MHTLLANLNEAQQEAVQNIDGPLLILAGAGSGKTKTITTRLAYLLDEVGIPPENTLTLTFTNKAAREMQHRALAMIKPTTTPPLLCTFHKFGLLFLKFHMHILGRSPNFVIIDSNDKKGIVKRLVNDFHKECQISPALIGNEISHYKNSILTPDEVRDQAQIEEEKQIASIYARYEAYLHENNLVDFDDLILLSYRIMELDPALATQTSQRYNYIMIDEYQDTNELQLQLLFKLTSAHTNLCVVGDDDQSIYGWRGANIRNILEFDKQFQETKVIKLEHNYRSTKAILEAANTLIAHNRGRYGKTLLSTKGQGSPVETIESNDENEEAATIARRIKALLSKGIAPNEIAVLYRVNALSRALEEGLNRAQVPYKLVGGQRFYDRLEIKDYISYLRALTNLQDDFSIRRIINKPKRGLGKVTLDKIDQAALDANQSLFEYLTKVSNATLESLIKAKNATVVRSFIQTLQMLLDIAQNQSYGLIDRLEEAFELRPFYKMMPEGSDRLRNIDEFKGLFNHHITVQNGNLDSFLNEIALESDQDQIEGESIYIMSVHASKGLEFGHLFVIGMEEGFFPLTGDGADIEEERRLGYVAMTRAKEGLVLSHVNSRFHFGKRELLKKSSFLAEAGLVAGAISIAPSTSLKKGDIVKHKIFGMGRVLAVSKAGKEYKLKINFGGNTRDILSSFVERI
ncbi:MAG: ATP-dependent DNA helicase [Sulfuricurvum sp. PC08-66]|nr:MAG: ATP-dependent DNA helicase [Sulfuricurvum sp. PC08-66]